jgi:hypothetical protein
MRIPLFRLVAVWLGDERQFPVHVQLPSPALFCRLLQSVRARETLVLDNQAKHNIDGCRYGGIRGGYDLDPNWTAGRDATALAADARRSRVHARFLPCSETGIVFYYTLPLV